jgi:hypothetical protein
MHAASHKLPSRKRVSGRLIRPPFIQTAGTKRLAMARDLQYSTLCYRTAMRVFLVPQVVRLIRQERLPEAALCPRRARWWLAPSAPGRRILAEACSKSELHDREVARAAAIASSSRVVSQERSARAVHLRLREERRLDADTAGPRSTGQSGSGVPGRE